MEGCLLRRYAGAGTLAPPERYETVLRAAPRPHPDDTDERSLLPAPQSLLDASAGDRMRALAPLTTDSGAGADRTAVSRLKEVCAHFAAAAVGRFADGAPEFTVGDLVAAGVQEPYRRLLHLLLSLAQEYGLAEPAESAPGGGQRWRLIGVPRPDDMHRSLLNDHPGQAVIATVYGRCGLHLADVLRGAHNPHELLFADADRHLVEQLYHQALGLAGHHRAARELLRAAVRAWPADRPLRILEAGAGTGGATGWLLEVLPPERTQSVFTDISAAFFPRARARFRSYDFVDYRTLDLDRGLEEQGFTPGSFDLVVAHNVPHAAKDLRACLDRVAWLLADDGQLMATEQHDPAFLVLCFGLLPSFSSLLLARRTGTTRVPSTSALEPRPPSPAAAADWVIVAENPEADLAQALASTLSTSGRATVRQAAGTTGPDRLPSSTTTEPVPSRAVLLLDDGPDAPWSAPGAAAATALAAHRIATLTGLAAAADAETAAEGAKPELWLVTRPRGAQPAPEAATHPQDAAVWGAARGLANEHPGLTVRRISLERGTDPGADACRLAAELSAPDAEDEVVLTRAGRFTPRITALSASPRAVQPADDGSGRYRLEFHDPGLSHRLSWTPMAPCAPGPDEVLIEVRAAGLNYRDVMRATGLLASGAAQQNLGLECAGVVAQVGSRVADLAVGDRVFAMAMPALASQVVAHRSLVGRMPDGVGFAAAATVPVACLTVRYALGGLARLRPDDTLLVHGAAGGVGLAALQFARDRGTQVIATAGTPAKRDLLRLLGVTRVADSRAADFADHVRDLTAGQGVDVVLNSLAGEGLTRSLELLKAGGRFVELGKRDIDVRGVVHAAMVLDDAQLAQLSQERVQAVLGPKMHGTLLLDAYTTNCDLDFFVAYSSLSALVGNAGQGPYAAANLFLEALARARRRTGKPAPAIAWGAIGETGYVARHQEMAQAVQRWGLEDVSPAEACAALDDVLARGPAVVGIGRVDWARAGRVLPENGLRVLRD
ncbi:KR domain-containing protein [Streptomyces sp. NPDC003032]